MGIGAIKRRGNIQWIISINTEVVKV